MIAAGMTFEYPDGTQATIVANRFGGWNIVTESSTLTGITDEVVAQHIARSQKAKAAAHAEAAIAARAAALVLELAWDAAAKENEKRRLRAARGPQFVPGSAEARYAGIDARHDVPTEIMLWLECHYSAITGTVKNLVQFAANYEEAGHLYADGMPGICQSDERTWHDTFVIRLDGTPIPYAMLDGIARLQNRCGIREGQPPSFNQGKGIYCNALAWELIRRGATVGLRSVK